MSPNLDGKWTGELVYNNSFGVLANEKLLFVIEITQVNLEFTGTSFDIDGIGINPTAAVVKGFVDGDQINFVKEYKSSVKNEFNTSFFNTAYLKGAEISFSGVYDLASNAFEGEWVNLSDFLIFDPLALKALKGGSWRMSRDNF